MLLAAGANRLVRALLGPTCASCDAPLLQPVLSPVCAGCWDRVAPLTAPACVRCAEPLPQTTGPYCARCTGRRPAFTVARSAGAYDGPLRGIVHAFKFERRRTLAAPLAALMREAGADLLAGADAVVPVPLHRWRSVRRGFNQADDLAVRLGPPVWRVLRRCRAGPPQSALAGADRRANVTGAFALQPFGRHRWPLRNRAVVLVDDVMTTGATLEACAAVLRAAGVRRVAALTLARAAAPRARPPARPPTPRPSTAPRQ